MLDYFWFFFCFFGCVLFFKNQSVFVLDLSFNFLVSYDFFHRLGNRLQKNKLSSFKLV